MTQAREEQNVRVQEALGDPAAEVATGGGWVFVGDLTRQLRRLPPWAGVHPALLPLAVLFVLAAQVGAYFGVPPALLHSMALALLGGYSWPAWKAREIANYWTPAERHLRVAVFSEAMIVESAGLAEKISFEEIRWVQRAAEGWLLCCRRRPTLWVPRGGFGELHGEMVAQTFARLPQASSRGRLGWMYVGAGGASVVGTALWYFST